jgi:uncharacterized membrane protein YbaN (DUF454 family)
MARCRAWADFFFAKSSKRLDTWFRGTKLYKNNLESFVYGQGMPWKAKLRILGSITLVMVVGFITMRHFPIGQICLGVVWVSHVIAFVFMIKTRSETEDPAGDPDERPLEDPGDALPAGELAPGD